jgi:hypothetical protein
MKKIVIALLLMTAIVGCKKSTTETAIYKAIYGNWELRSSFCGYLSFTNYAVGNGTNIIFNSAGRYRTTGSSVDSGIYSIRMNTNSMGQPEYVLYLNGSSKSEYRMKISNDTLRLDVIAFTTDGCWYNYHKL